MSKRMLFVYNPKSGKGAIRSKLTDIMELFTAAGYNVLIHPTSAPKDATEAVRQLSREADVIVCSGGDGTMDEVVTGIMQTNPLKTVGYIPSGSTNDFANSLGFPKNLIKATQTILKENVYSCDRFPHDLPL